MSIEQSLKDLQTAVEALTEAFIAHTNDVRPSPTPKAKEDKQKSVEVVVQSVPVEKAAPAKKPPIKAAEVEQILAKEEAAQSDIEYATIQTLIKANVQKNRAQITKVLAKYGIKTATELLQEQYAPFYNDLKAELPGAGTEDDLA